MDKKQIIDDVCYEYAKTNILNLIHKYENKENTDKSMFSKDEVEEIFNAAKAYHDIFTSYYPETQGENK